MCAFPASDRIFPSTNWTIPRPDPETLSMFQNTNRNSLLFLHAAGIRKNSTEHKDLMKTVQDLHRQHMRPFKYVEEQKSRADQVIANAHIHLSWLAKYEDSWPARVYLKRFVDNRRPHLMCSRYARAKQARTSRSRTSHNLPIPTKDIQPSDAPLGDHDTIVQEFLASLSPSLEHHLDTFVKLGVKDRKTLQAFLSFSQGHQEQFLHKHFAELQLTSLEQMGLLIGSGAFAQKTLKMSLGNVVKPGCFPL